MKLLTKFTLLAIFAIQPATFAESIWPEAIDDDMVGKIGQHTDNHAFNMLKLLESMPWIEEGNQQGEGRYIYVLYSPFAQKSREFYTKTRAYLDQVNIRWIPIIQGKTNVDGLYETRTPAALENAMLNSIIPTVMEPNVTNIVSNMTFTGFIYIRAAAMLSPEASSYYPTVIYGDHKKISVNIAPFAFDVQEIIDDVPLTTPNTSFPTMMELAKRPIELYKVDEHVNYLNESDQLATIFLYPSEDGVSIGALDGDRNPDVISGMTPNGYAAIDVNGRGNYIYLKLLDHPKIEIKPKDN